MGLKSVTKKISAVQSSANAAQVQTSSIDSGHANLATCRSLLGRSPAVLEGCIRDRQGRKLEKYLQIILDDQDDGLLFCRVASDDGS